jgi:hypothetical protein
MERRAERRSRRTFAEAKLEGPSTVSEVDPRWDDMWNETACDDDV